MSKTASVSAGGSKAGSCCVRACVCVCFGFGGCFIFGGGGGGGVVALTAGLVGSIGRWMGLSVNRHARTHLLVLKAVDDRDEVRRRQRGPRPVVLHGDVRAPAHLCFVFRVCMGRG